MTRITSESPNGKQRIVIDPSNETVTFFGCVRDPATSFFSFPRCHPEFVCPFEDILDIHEQWYADKRLPRRKRLRYWQIVTAHGSVWFRSDWTNSDETWHMLQAISASTPDAPMLTNVNVAQYLLIPVVAVIVMILIWIFLWLTGN